MSDLIIIIGLLAAVIQAVAAAYQLAVMIDRRNLRERKGTILKKLPLQQDKTRPGPPTPP